MASNNGLSFVTIMELTRYQWSKPAGIESLSLAGAAEAVLSARRAMPTIADAAKRLWRMSCVSVSTRSDRLRERNVDHVFRNKPDLQFVAANHIAHDQIVRAVIDRKSVV